MVLFFFSSRRRHTRFDCDWSSDVCSSDLRVPREERALHDLGQVDEREDRAVEVGEVGGEGGAFLPCELVGHLEGDLSTSPTVRRPYAGRLESARDRYYYLAASRSRCAIPLTAERSTWHEAQVPARCRPEIGRAHV